MGLSISFSAICSDFNPSTYFLCAVVCCMCYSVLLVTSLILPHVAHYNFHFLHEPLSLSLSLSISLCLSLSRAAVQAAFFLHLCVYVCVCVCVFGVRKSVCVLLFILLYIYMTTLRAIHVDDPQTITNSQLLDVF